MAPSLASPVLRLRTGPSAGKVYEIGTSLRIGRHPYNEVSLPDLSVSRYHCWLTFLEGRPWIEDLASANGTLVNGRRIASRVALRPGDVVCLGETELTFDEEAA
jgi:pSer/pThr/pTyr-binding forkhead associated (FHA) protein